MRSDIIEVHSETHWRILGRTVKTDEKPIKQVK